MCVRVCEVRVGVQMWVSMCILRPEEEVGGPPLFLPPIPLLNPELQVFWLGWQLESSGGPPMFVLLGEEVQDHA